MDRDERLAKRAGYEQARRDRLKAAGIKLHKPKPLVVAHRPRLPGRLEAMMAWY